jgi:diketogulonate reductase-like aldo/keto reductase
MRTTPFGPTGQAVPVIGQGTWYIEKAPKKDAIAALRQGIDLGLTHIDTAEMYGSGEAETIVGEAIAGRRDQAFLVSKVLPHNATRGGVIKACDASLLRLKADYLDCYLLHWPGSHPLAGTIEGFERLRKEGKIRAWGVSNFDVGELEEAWAIAGDGVIACNQVLYHLGERAIEHAVLPWCEKHDVALVGYSPFGHDDFPGPNSPGGRMLALTAQAHGATPRQVALAFLTRRPGLFTIPKAASAAHVADNAKAGDLRLTETEIAMIDYAFPLGRKTKGIPML